MPKIHMSNIKNFLFIIAAFFAGSVVSLTTTLALAHGGDTSLIHSCYKNSTGVVRIIGINDSCGRNETALDWNKEGLPGTGAYVNLSGINFFNSETGTSADFRYRNFKGADMSNSNFYDAHFAGADLRGANFTNTNLNGAYFDGRDEDDFTTTNFTNVNMGGATFQSVDLTGQDFTNVGKVQGTNFISSNLTNVDFSGLDFDEGGVDKSFQYSTLAGTNFTGANLVNANLNGVIGSGTDFTNANLTGADFSGHGLTSIVWNNTICPDGTNSNSHGNTCMGHL